MKLVEALVSLANKLDEDGHSKHAAAVDEVLREFAKYAEYGALSLDPEQQKDLLNAPSAPKLPPHAKGKVVIPSKAKDAAGYGFFSIMQIKDAINTGAIDPNAAMLAMQDYLKSAGHVWSQPPKTLQDVLDAMGVGNHLPIRSEQKPEVYGKKSLLQRWFGK